VGIVGTCMELVWNSYGSRMEATASKELVRSQDCRCCWPAAGRVPRGAAGISWPRSVVRGPGARGGSNCAGFHDRGRRTAGCAPTAPSASDLGNTAADTHLATGALGCSYAHGNAAMTGHYAYQP